jgi:uncharacterized membrane protein
MPTCPECGNPFQWATNTDTDVSARKDTTKNYLLNWYYWFKALAGICPIAGIVFLVLNKQYKNNLNRQKATVYDRFFKNVVVSCVVWAVLLIVISLAAGIAYKKAKNGV